MSNGSEDSVLPGVGDFDENGSCGRSSGGGGGAVLKKGPWTSAEDAILVEYVKKHGEGNWNAVQKHSGLFRCGKSCRLRWANHLRPNLKKGAFTAEEEQLIIELHAKMGNKWARMAAHLPGRTDNEIKNFWNTRIKRRQRAGLPLYPPELCLQALEENQQKQNSVGIHIGDKGCLDLLQNNNYEIPDVMFNSLNSNQGVLPCMPGISSISATSSLMKCLGSPEFHSFTPSTVRCQKRSRESMAPLSAYTVGLGNQAPFDRDQNDILENKKCQSFGLTFPYHPGPMTKNISPFGENQGCHSLLDGNFSASKPIPGAVKLELPSLQYPETTLGSWVSTPQLPLHESADSFILSPPPEPSKSDCSSPRNSGLLDALIHEAKALNGIKSQSPEKSSNSSTPTTASIFSECTPVSGTGSSFEENPAAENFPGHNAKIEPTDQMWTMGGDKQECLNQMESSRPDAILDSCWVERSYYSKEQALGADAIAAFLGDDLGNDFKNFGDGTAAAAGSGWVFGSCPWNNMPAVHQMSELP